MSTALATRQALPQHLAYIASARTLPATREQARGVGRNRGADTSASGLDRIGVPAVYLAGKTIFEAGDPVRSVYRVAHGVVRAVRLLADGRRCITNFFSKGDFIALSENEEHSYTLEAVTDSGLTSYPRRPFDAALESDPRIGRDLLNLMCSELSATHERLLLLGRKSAIERIATFLLSMADPSPSVEGDDEIRLPMSRGDIADYLGLTIETVSRTFAQLVRSKAVALPKPNHVVLIDRDALEDISTGDA